MYETITIDSSTKHLLHVSLNRPKALNALNVKLLSELKDLWNNLNQYHPRLIVIQGSERAFAAGADITEINGLSNQEAAAFSQSGQRVFEAIESCNIPTIAIIQGYALGGGLELAMACHMRICNESAKMGMPEINLGLLPGYAGSQRLARLIGKSKAMEMTLTGDMISGRQAESLGLVGSCYVDEEFEEKSQKLISKLLRKAPLAAQKIVEAINADLRSEIDGAALESKFFGELMDTHDLKEGVAAFLEKRKATFKGE